MKNEHCKMKVMMGAVIAGANQVMEMDCVNGAWDIPRALQLYGGVKELFAYHPNQSKPVGTIRLAGGLFTIYT